MGMSSEEVMDPRCSLQLWNVWFLDITMSGNVVLLCRIKVGNCGRKCTAVLINENHQVASYRVTVGKSQCRMSSV